MEADGLWESIVAVEAKERPRSSTDKRARDDAIGQRTLCTTKSNREGIPDSKRSRSRSLVGVEAKDIEAFMLVNNGEKADPSFDHRTARRVAAHGSSGQSGPL